jgi:hypothetical protein
MTVGFVFHGWNTAANLPKKIKADNNYFLNADCQLPIANCRFCVIKGLQFLVTVWKIEKRKLKFQSAIGNNFTQES